MKTSQAIAKLEAKRAQLEKRLAGRSSNNPDCISTEVSELEGYLEEITLLISSVSYIEKEIYIVPLTTLETKAKKADFASIEEEGYNFRLVLIQNYPYDDIYMIYLKPLTSF